MPHKDDWFYATQELLDALPRVWTRGLLYLLFAFATIRFPWAMLSKVDETGIAEGRLESKEGSAISVDAPVAGTLAIVHVEEGEMVEPGDILMKLESERVITELQEAQAKVEEAERAILENQWQLEQVESDTKYAQVEFEKEQSDSEKENSSEIISLRSQIAQTNNEIKSLQAKLEQRVVRATTTGRIVSLPIQRTGSVVQPGQVIAEIAPPGTPLVLRAQMLPRESESLQEGMPVKVKFDGYPSQDYGVVSGYLSEVSRDPNELEITLEKPYIQTKNKQYALTPGQTATAEVIVRQRRVIDFVFSLL